MTFSFILIVALVIATMTTTTTTMCNAQSSDTALSFNRTIYAHKGDAILVDFWKLFNRVARNLKTSKQTLAPPASSGGAAGQNPATTVIVDASNSKIRGKLLPVRPTLTRAKIYSAINFKPPTYRSQRQFRRDKYLEMALEPSQLGQAAGKEGLFVYSAKGHCADAPFTDEVRFTYGSEWGGLYSGVLFIHVFNVPPIVRASTTLFGIGGNYSSFIPVADFDMDLCGGLSEIKKVTINGTAGNGCSLATNAKGLESKPLKEGTVLRPSNDPAFNEMMIRATGVIDETRCEFTFVATDASGAESGTGTFKVMPRRGDGRVSPLVVYDTRRNFWPQKQKVLSVSLTAFDSNDKKFRQRVDFFVDQLPQLGTLYNVMQLEQNASTTDSGRLGMSRRRKYANVDLESSTFLTSKLTAESIKRPIVAGTLLRRVFLLYVGPKWNSTVGFKDFINQNDTFKWHVAPVAPKKDDPDSSSVVDGNGPSRIATVVVRLRDRILHKGDTSKPGSGSNNNRTNASPLVCGPRVYRYIFADRSQRNVRLNFSLPAGDEILNIRVTSETSVPSKWGALYEDRYSLTKDALVGVDANKLGNMSKSGTNIVVVPPRRDKSVNSITRMRRLRPGNYLYKLHWPKLQFSPYPTGAKYVLNEERKRLQRDNQSAPLEISQTYSFVIATRYGGRCMSTVKFILRAHAPVKQGNYSATSFEPYIIYDTAPYGEYTLLSLGGRAVRNNAEYKYAKVIQKPKWGSLFRVSRALPYEANMTVQDRVDPALDSYCGRHSCARYVEDGGKALAEGDSVERWKAFSRSSVTELQISTERFWALYRERSVFGNQSKPKKDSFVIRLCKTKPGNDAFYDTGDCDVNTIKYNMYLTEGKLRRVYVPFTPAPQIANLGRDVSKVLIQLTSGLANESAAVKSKEKGTTPVTDPTQFVTMVLPYDNDRRHNTKPNFLLLNARRNGGEIVPGQMLGATNSPPQLNGGYAKGIPFGMWVQNSENYIFLVPRARSVYHSFRFRVRIFRLADVKSGKFTDPVEDVRVIAVRENSVPVWQDAKAVTLTGLGGPNPNPNVLSNAGSKDRPLWVITPKIGEPVRLDLNAYDEDNDPLWYVVLEAPKHGELRFMSIVAGTADVAPLSSTVAAYKGYRFKVDKLASGEWGMSTAHVVYTPKFEVSAKYPQEDRFVIAVDDGGGVPSLPLQVPVKIQLGRWSQKTLPPKDGKIVNGPGGVGTTVTGGSAAVAKVGLLVLVVAAVAVGAYFLRRRGQMRQRFQRLARGVEGALEGDDSTEMS